MLPKTQKAAQYNPVSGEVEINTIPVPQIKDDEILIKTTAASLCHSDIVRVRHLWHNCFS
jgi:D-arabinose 1-dehydrogenase-like Zn-dependent alcohol dehydrogenase